MKKIVPENKVSIPVEFNKYFWDCDILAPALPKYRNDI